MIVERTAEREDCACLTEPGINTVRVRMDIVLGQTISAKVLKLYDLVFNL